jgi:preprotein translocase subunit SecA
LRKVAAIGEENFIQFERVVLLQSIVPSNWRAFECVGYALGYPFARLCPEASLRNTNAKRFELFGQLLDSVKKRGPPRFL